MIADPPTRLRAELSVSVATDADRERWQRFVSRHPDASFFHRFEWRALIAGQWRHEPYFLIASRGDDVAGILPLALVRSRLFGTSLVSLPFCVYGGPVTDDAEALAALDARALEIAQDAGAAHVEYRSVERAHPEWPSTDLYASFRKPISANDDENLNAIPRKQRAMVRKGIANGLSSAFDDVDGFFPVYSDNVHRHGTPGFPGRWFRALRDAFGDDCDTLAVRDRDGRTVSAVLSFYFRDEVLPYYAGDLESARGLAANDFKYWELMRHAAARGCRVFDYGRSKVGTGPYSFKKNWGFVPRPLGYEYRLLTRDSVPQNNPSNPKYRLLIAAWRRLPRPFVEWLGPRLVRGLG